MWAAVAFLRPAARRDMCRWAAHPACSLEVAVREGFGLREYATAQGTGNLGIPGVSHIIAVSSGKGGVGKSTTAGEGSTGAALCAAAGCSQAHRTRPRG